MINENTITVAKRVEDEEEEIKFILIAYNHIPTDKEFIPYRWEWEKLLYNKGKLRRRKKEFSDRAYYIYRNQRNNSYMRVHAL